MSAITLPDTLLEVLGLDPANPIAVFSVGIVASAVVASVMLANTAVAGPWAKRKITARFTDRIAVNHLGPAGIFIIVADSIRLLSKELIIPEGADRPAYDLAPIVLAGSALLGFAVVPLGSGLQVADPEIGLIYVFAVSSMASLGLLMAGYASNNKYSFLGGLRAVAQNIAYEIPLVLTAVSVVLIAGTLQLSEIVALQQETLLEVGPIAIPTWYAILNPFAFVLFFAANLAEVGRNPFDIPEAPTELVGGYQTEYGSVYFVLFYLGEFIHIFLGGAIIATLFLGGPAGPGPAWLGLLWFTLKIWVVFLLTQWARSAVPRVRIDQLIDFGWKRLLVLAFANFVGTAILVGAL
ncbi:MAG: complex I subunit 1/NuoH family protein [Halococcoides sp.]